MKKRKILILLLLLLATIAVACLYRYPPKQWNLGKSIFVRVERDTSSLQEKNDDVFDPSSLSAPKIPEWPLAEVYDAEYREYDIASGSVIYHVLQGTTLNWVRKSDEKVSLGSVVVDQGKVAIQNKAIVAGAFVFDLESLRTLGENDEELIQYLQGETYLDVKNNPIASFILHEMKGNTLSGILTMSGVSKEIRFPAVVSIDDRSLRIRADFSLDRRDFGIVVPKDLNPFLDVHIQRVLEREE